MIAPPNFEDLKIGTKLISGLGSSTIIPDMDFETYSPAGFRWDPETNRYKTLQGASKKGLPAIGAAKYTEDPAAEVLCLAYNLKMGKGPQLWIPNDPLPFELFDYLHLGGLIEAWNAPFEYWVWTNICEKKYYFPKLDPMQLRCAAAKSRAFCLPPSLDAAGTVVDTIAKKNKDGKRLINKFCIPRAPTIKDRRHRIIKDEELPKLYEYCLQDIKAESEISSNIPDLSPLLQEFWHIDHRINIRGVQIDIDSIEKAIDVFEKCQNGYNIELLLLTEMKVNSASKVEKLKDWILENGDRIEDLSAGSVKEFLEKKDINEFVKKALEIRQAVSYSSVKKLYSMKNQMTKDQRLHDLFIFHSARTGRTAGAGPQPQNLPNHGPDVLHCQKCDVYYSEDKIKCPKCFSCSSNSKIKEWNPSAMEFAIDLISGRNLSEVKHYFTNPIELISGCLRGMFISKPGHDLICSDYSAIEAVVLAALAGEEWRLEVFRTHGKIYEMSAAKITGMDFEEFERYRLENGMHHPSRKKIGKVAELASGYGGWIGAWKKFGADQFFSDDEIKKLVLAWRKENPNIVEFWGGQHKNGFKNLYGLEGCAISAVLDPGKTYAYKGIEYLCQRDVLYCKLLSGRHITYHKPMLAQDELRYGNLSLSYEGWNTNPLHGRIGWIRMRTYGGKLTENVIQATSFDILANGIINLEKANYPVVLQIHDEVVCEVPENFGSVAEVEKLMSMLPEWAKGWPIKASGGWRGKRYHK